MSDTSVISVGIAMGEKSLHDAARGMFEQSYSSFHVFEPHLS
ncbi:MAG: hypothetical protein ACYTXA_29795 [Nostoc sp.]